MIAVDKSRWESFRVGDLISPGYVALQRDLHARPRGYGGRGNKWADTVRRLIARFHCTSVLDYGCGQGSLVATLGIDKPTWLRLDEFDAAIDGKNDLPSFADLVVCTDVLEHVEPDKLDAVVGHLRMLARKAVFVVIATRPSNKTMADGRNAHLIVEPAAWWVRRIMAAGWSVEIDGNATNARELVAVLTHAPEPHPC